MRLFFCFIVVGLAVNQCVLAQESAERFSETSAVLYNQFERMYSQPNEQTKLQINDSIIVALKEELAAPESFFYRFDTLRRTGIIYSPDEALRIFTWNIPLQNGSHMFFGILQFYDKKWEENKVIVLEDKGKPLPGNPEMQSLAPDQWLGALYYRIVPVKVGRDVFYTLLGFRPNDLFTSKKVIDVVWFNENERVKFGYPLFQIKRELKHRLIFEYNARVSMNLDYLNDLEMIIYDHLAPERSSYKGDYEFYGPDGSFDGLLFDKKTDLWQLNEDVDLRAPKLPAN